MKVYCKSFKDHSSSLEFAHKPKLLPHNKHVNAVYHHFRLYDRDKIVSMFPINTLNKTTGIFAKTLL